MIYCLYTLMFYWPESTRDHTHRTFNRAVSCRRFTYQTYFFTFIDMAVRMKWGEKMAKCRVGIEPTDDAGGFRPQNAGRPPAHLMMRGPCTQRPTAEDLTGCFFCELKEKCLWKLQRFLIIYDYIMNVSIISSVYSRLTNSKLLHHVWVGLPQINSIEPSAAKLFVSWKMLRVVEISWFDVRILRCGQVMKVSLLQCKNK